MTRVDVPRRCIEKARRALVVPLLRLGGLTVEEDPPLTSFTCICPILPSKLSSFSRIRYATLVMPLLRLHQLIVEEKPLLTYVHKYLPYTSYDYHLLAESGTPPWWCRCCASVS
jgi:hypothetical protein